MKRKWIAWAIVMVILILGAVMWMTKEERTQRAMMNYLEDKYGEKFEMEFFDKGDLFFPDLYGDDKMMVHPVGKPEIPFYVFKDETPSGFSDSYVRSFFSVQYTEKYEAEILSMDSRKMAIKFDLASANWPDGAEVMDRTIDEVVLDKANKINIVLHLAIESESKEIDIKAESQFLYDLYTYIDKKRNEGEQVSLAVAYIHTNHFQEAEALLRTSHAINFHWGIMHEEQVISAMYFGTGNDIQGPEFFLKYAK